MIDLYITGGTIDVAKITEGDKYHFNETFIPTMLEQGRSTLDIQTKVLFMKDSLYTDDSDRNQIVENCKESKSKMIVITHGTDTMAQTGRLLKENIEDKTIVLVGAIVPFINDKSDSMFNLGSALIAVQLLPTGVYVVMNGRVFDADKVTKDIDSKIFKEIQ